MELASMLLTQPIWVLLALWGLYIISLSIYRLWFSPIAKFPGPKIAALTGWYEFYYDVIKRGKYTFKIAEFHQKYGPIVRISPHEIHVDDPEYYAVLYSRDSPRNKWDFFARQFNTTLSIMSTVQHETHKMLRAHMNPFFSTARIRRLEPKIQALVNKLCHRLGDFKESGVPINVQYAFTAFATDVVSEYTMGEEYNYLDAPDFVPLWSETISGIAKSAVMFKHLPWLFPIFMSMPEPIVSYFDPGMTLLFEHRMRCNKRIRSVLDSDEVSTMKQRVLDGSMQPTLFHDIISSNLPERYKSAERLAQEMQVIIGAGAETIAKTLSFITFYLLNEPEKLHKLRQELNELDPDRKASCVDFERMPYLNGVILEGLRLSYGLPTRLQRIAPYHDLSYGDWMIPKGTPVGMTSMFLHHNESIFPDSYSFKPERWVDLDTRKRLDKYLVSFTKGSRQCIGINLARTEMFLTVPKIFRDLDFELYETTVDDVRIIHDLFLPFPKLTSKGVRVLVK